MSNGIEILEEMEKYRIFLSKEALVLKNQIQVGNVTYLSQMLREWIEDPVGRELIILLAAKLYTSKKEVTIESLLTHDSIIARELGSLAQQIVKNEDLSRMV
jgi:hypothetical protein